jgi:hypothetical protein
MGVVDSVIKRAVTVLLEEIRSVAMLLLSARIEVMRASWHPRDEATVGRGATRRQKRRAIYWPLCRKRAALPPPKKKHGRRITRRPCHIKIPDDTPLSNPYRSTPIYFPWEKRKKPGTLCQECFELSLFNVGAIFRRQSTVFKNRVELVQLSPAG